MTINSKILLRVKAGIAFLNSIYPGWVKKIKLKNLDLSDKNTCVIGELYDDYFDGISEMGITDNGAARALGFQVNQEEPEDTGISFDALTKVWVKEIRKLK